MGTIKQSLGLLFQITLVVFIFCTSVAAAPTFTDLSNPVAVRAEVQPFIERERHTYQIPGAEFILVCDGKVIICDGFGQANLATGTPVDPNRTRFAVGSLSKVVTATAVMQQVDSGKMNLDADVNLYLSSGGAPFRIPETFTFPITAGQLLTHTAGLEDTHIGVAARTPAAIMPLDKYLAEHLPGRVMPPDVIAGYCNDGFALLGYLVQLTSHEPFEAYIDQHVFQPLKMNHSSFYQSSMPQVDRAQGYDGKGQLPVPVDALYLHDVPAASMTTTAADMGHLLIALLQDTPSPASILSPEAVRSMQIVRFRNAPHASGWTYGLHGATNDGEHRLEHGGLYRGFTAKLVLLPDRHAGFFAVYNRYEPRVLAELDSLFAPSLPIAAMAPPPKPEELERLCGSYRAALYPRHSLERISTLLDPVRIEILNGQLVITDAAGARPLRCVAPGHFVRADGVPGAEAIFRQDESGRTHLVYGGDDFLLLAWYFTANTQLFVLALLVIILLPHCFISILPGRISKWLGRLACIGALITVALMGFFISRIDSYEFLFGIPLRVQFIVVLPWLVAMLSAGIGISFVRAWFKGNLSRFGRARVPVVLIALMTLMGVLFHWNLVFPFAG